jgi:hypothetical protein
MSKERINIYATERQKRQVEKRCQEENLPVVEIIWRVLDAYLAWDDPTYTPCSSPTKGRPIHPQLVVWETGVREQLASKVSTPLRR